ncbi:bacillithiol biosynthesis cysteine-adding enzyme BshC [Paenibacillaceae bacterium]|nr:bacillithiol biosynthesis cysteine-adding enzyme BshC [Paenibacillaceae bacterium]
MKWERFDLPAGPRLTDAYVHQKDPRVAELFGYHPEEPASWERRAKRLDQTVSSRADASELADALHIYNSKWQEPSGRAAHNIQLLGAGALAIVGGQQAGLWTGPLMVIHKAVSIIQAARRASADLQRPVVPIFWIAGEDHDWEEAGHTYLVSSKPSLQKLSVNRSAANRTSVSRTKLLQADWDRALQQLAAALPDYEYKPEFMNRLHALAEQADSLPEMFAGIMSWLFGQEGLVLLDADDPSLRRLESPMFKRLIAQNDELESALAEAAAQIAGMEYDVQAAAAPGSANLFVYLEDDNNSSNDYSGDRILLHKSEGEFADRKGLFSASSEQLMTIAEEHPERLSNNVLTRPIMQDYVLPVLATVLGPGEIAYWAMTGKAFQVFGMEMPIVVPRMSFTIIEPTSQKHMERFGLPSLSDIMSRVGPRKRELLEEWGDPSLDGRFDEVTSAMMELYEPLLQMAADGRPPIAALVETNKRKIVAQIEFIRGRVNDEISKKHERALRQLDRLQTVLWPDGKPQERVINFAEYWARYECLWIKQLFEVPHDWRGGHHIVYL